MICKRNSALTEVKNLNELTEETIIVPIQQRDFVWNEKKAEPMINEIIEISDFPPSSKRSHKIDLSSIIIHCDGNDKVIWEGQQRTITLLIFKICINDFINRHSLSIDKMHIGELKHEKLVRQNKWEDFYNNNKRKTMPYGKIYQFITDKLEMFCKDDKNLIENVIDTIKNNIFVECKIYLSADEAFNAFVQINAGGKALSKDEIIMSTLEEYQKRYNIKIKINKSFLKQAVLSYNAYINGISNSSIENSDVISFMKEHIVKDADTFKNFIDICQQMYNIEDTIEFKILDGIKKQQIMTIFRIISILNISKEKKIEYINNIILSLISICLIWKFKNINPGGKSLSLFKTIVMHLKENADIKTIMECIQTFIRENKDICTIPHNDFIMALADIEQSVSKSIFLMMAKIYNKSLELKLINIHLEHIYPQKPDIKWEQNGWYKDTYSQYIKDIGNHMLLNGKINVKIQNKYITDKIKEYYDGINTDIALQMPINKVDFDRFKDEKETYIKERREFIAYEIIEYFPLMKMLVI